MNPPGQQRLQPHIPGVEPQVLCFPGLMHGLATCQISAETATATLSSNPKFVTETDCLDRTPAHACAFKGHEEVMKTILDLNGRVLLREDCCGKTPLQVASHSDHQPVVQLILGRMRKLVTGEDVPDDIGPEQTIWDKRLDHDILTAAEFGQAEALQYLLHKREKYRGHPEDLNSADGTRNVMQLAAGSQSRAAVSTLIYNGVSMTHQPPGKPTRTPKPPRKHCSTKKTKSLPPDQMLAGEALSWWQEECAGRSASAISSANAFLVVNALVATISAMGISGLDPVSLSYDGATLWAYHFLNQAAFYIAALTIVVIVFVTIAPRRSPSYTQAVEQQLTAVKFGGPSTMLAVCCLIGSFTAGYAGQIAGYLQQRAAGGSGHMAYVYVPPAVSVLLIGLIGLAVLMQKAFDACKKPDSGQSPEESVLAELLVQSVEEKKPLADPTAAGPAGQ